MSDRLAAIETKLTLLTWMIGLNLALTLSLFSVTLCTASKSGAL